MSTTETTESSAKTVGEVAVRIVPDFSALQQLIDYMTPSSVLTSSTVTITVNEEEDTPAAELVPWKAILAVEGHPTDDNTPAPRLLLRESLTWRDLPLPFMVQTVTPSEGHEGAVLSGRIDEITRMRADELADSDFADVLADVPGDALLIFGRGVFDVSNEGEKGAHLVEGKMLRGVSVDLVATTWAFADRESLELIDDEDVDLADVVTGRFYRALTSGQIGAATATPVQALGPATIALAAAAGGWNRAEATFILEDALVAGSGLTAAAPRVVARDTFFRPEAEEPTPLTITDEREVFGHAFLWETCHTGFADRCVMAPFSESEYAFFHLGAVETIEGDEVAVGQITLDTGHADLRAGRNATRRHYDDTGVAAADVRIVDGELGGWLSGALRDVTDEDVRKLKAAKLSGDWRRVNGHLELIGLLAVNVPGFPVPRTEARLVAGGEGSEVCALVAAGLWGEDAEMEELLTAIQERSQSEMLDELEGCADTTK